MIRISIEISSNKEVDTTLGMETIFLFRKQELRFQLCNNYSKQANTTPFL